MFSPFFFFSETLSSVSAPDFLLFLPSHPVIGASGTSRQDVSALRDAGVPLPHGRDRKASVCLGFPAKPRGNIPVLFASIVSYDFIKCLRRLILAPVCHEGEEKNPNLFQIFFLRAACQSLLITRNKTQQMHQILQEEQFFRVANVISQYFQSIIYFWVQSGILFVLVCPD